jgi:demethylmenaquinone methyltransferase/2-methoxy-6-polyprenyl-1,4-benzoquinol methylase
MTDYLFLGQFPRITMRKTLIEMMDLKPGDTVLDFACGAGANFPYIMEKIGPTGKLIATDYSQDMLDAARDQIVTPNGWTNVELVQGDAAQMHFDQEFDVVMVTLGLAVIPGWETAMERAWSMLKPGGVFGVADLSESDRWYTQPIRWLTDFIDAAIIADSSRRPWEWMETHGKNYQREEIFHGYFYAATVRKP